MATNEQRDVEIHELEVQCGIHEQRLNKLEQEVEKLHIENKAIYEINTNIRVLTENLTTVKDDISEVKDDISDVKSSTVKLGDKFNEDISDVKKEVDEIKNQPSKSKAVWLDKLIWLLVGGVGTTLVAYIADMFIK